jgi:hypothetical protein
MTEQKIDKEDARQGAKRVGVRYVLIASLIGVVVALVLVAVFVG